jgi:hypothetical protein
MESHPLQRLPDRDLHRSLCEYPLTTAKYDPFVNGRPGHLEELVWILEKGCLNSIYLDPPPMRYFGVAFLCDPPVIRYRSEIEVLPGTTSMVQTVTLEGRVRSATARRLVCSPLQSEPTRPYANQRDRSIEERKVKPSIYKLPP